MTNQKSILCQRAVDGDTQALAELRKLAITGNAQSQLELGSMYYHGEGVEHDCTEAVKWFSLAAEQGDAQAQFALGTAYSNGEGIRKDLYEALKWHQMAAEQGHPDAELYVGEFCEQRFDEPQAAVWYERAAKHGNAVGDYYLGLYYKDGRGGLPCDLERAEQCFLRASYYVEAAYEYYDCFKKRMGDSEDGDWDRAVALLKQSADGGYAPAQYTLGMLYESAEMSEDSQLYLRAAAKQEYPLAVKYLKEAANKKYTTAYAEQALHSINVGDYATALAHLKKSVKRDRDGECSYWYGDFWEHNYGNLLPLPWGDNRPDKQSRIDIAASWYAYSYMCGYEAAWERLARCFLIVVCKMEPTAERIASVDKSFTKEGYLKLSYENCTLTYYGTKPGL